MFRKLANVMVMSTRSTTDLCAQGQRGLLLGAYDGCEPGTFNLTYTAEKFDDCIGGKIKEFLKGSTLKKGKAFVLGNISEDYAEVGIVGVGPEGAGYNSKENLDECKENIRVAAGVGARALQNKGVSEIWVEGFTNTEATAEGVTLGLFRYQDLKAPEDRFVMPKLNLYDNVDELSWRVGRIKGRAQNMARSVVATPANIMTPSIFGQYAVEQLCPCGVQVEVRSRDFVEGNGMYAFLEVAKGSCEPPMLVELTYCGDKKEVKPIVLIGKGTTFDAGGINLKRVPKECYNRMKNRGDMAGAAVVMAVFKAAAQMNLPINLVGLIPLCENMISGMALKPGDVLRSHNGKTIMVDHTDNEGRVMLADVLSFSTRYKPCLVLDIADLGTGMMEGLGSMCSAIFSNSDEVWRELNRAGAETGDRFWRFPFWKHYSTRINDYISVDVNNMGRSRHGKPCLGAAFLTEFAPPVDFVHIDISGTGILATSNQIPYLKKGLMTGRPVRSLVQFLYNLACPHSTYDDC